MTTQIPDTLRLEAEPYEIGRVSGHGLFDPEAHGLSVVPPSTACWRGHVCSYTLVDEMLQLDAVDAEVRPPGRAPPIHGRAAELRRGERFNTRYRSLELPLSFTGRLLVGGGDTVAHGAALLGEPWSHERVLLLSFADGTLEARRDVSGEMAAFREALARADGVEAASEVDRAMRAWVDARMQLGA